MLRRSHARDVVELSAKAAAAEDAALRCRDLESAQRALRRELAEAREEAATLAKQVRRAVRAAVSCACCARCLFLLLVD